MLATCLLTAALVGDPTFQVLIGSEDFTGLKKSDLPEDLHAALLLHPDGGYIPVGGNAKRTGEANPDTMGRWIAKVDSAGQLVWWRRIHHSDTWGGIPSIGRD